VPFAFFTHIILYPVSMKGRVKNEKKEEEMRGK
jgi:hypothetical protein